ncbi:hypothetical protein NPIL_509361 [Nephila pilipes]|uniref:Uncharacterized protein n=1 Tax=Nephila pilipes TaxID=299642 RepID=A0A8X6N5J6_NEPPI|nr:hypothetical protein NPIL_509361 [Nephila pilipes]
MRVQLILRHGFRIWSPYLVASFKSAPRLFSLTERISDDTVVLCFVLVVDFSVGVNRCHWEVRNVLLIVAPKL